MLTLRLFAQLVFARSKVWRTHSAIAGPWTTSLLVCRRIESRTASALRSSVSPVLCLGTTSPDGVRPTIHIGHSRVHSKPTDRRL
jgi:hypothetical protein